MRPTLSLVPGGQAADPQDDPPSTAAPRRRRTDRVVRERRRRDRRNGLWIDAVRALFAPVACTKPSLYYRVLAWHRPALPYLFGEAPHDALALGVPHAHVATILRDAAASYGATLRDAPVCRDRAA